MTVTENDRLKRLRLLARLPIKSLVSMGFGLTVLPLLFGMYSAYLAVENLAGIYQQTIHQVVRQVQNSRQIIEISTSLERKSEHFIVLDDLASLKAYQQEREQFNTIIENLLGLDSYEEVKKSVENMKAYEQLIYARLVADKPATKSGKLQALSGPEEQRLLKASLLFQELHAKAREIAQRFSNDVDMEANTLLFKAKSVQRNLIVQSLSVLPVSLLLIILFVRMIITPIRQIDHAIRGLGMGHFDIPIKVSGTLDLEYLGERLEWLRTRLNELEQAKQSFMHNVSHAIKSPLATLREGADMLGDELIGPLNTEQVEITKMLITTTHKVEDLIDALIRYDQANIQRQNVGMEPVEFDLLIMSSLEEHSIQLRAKRINVKTTLEPVKIVSNSSKLRTIIDNLLSNAIKFSPLGGDILISLNKISGHAVLEVEDNGIGIDSDERQKIFEPFFQGRSSREGGSYGTGLGLAILSECINNLQGTVEVFEAHGSGARFMVKIPID